MAWLSGWTYRKSLHIDSSAAGSESPSASASPSVSSVAPKVTHGGGIDIYSQRQIAIANKQKEDKKKAILVNDSLMTALKVHYGKEEGEKVYVNMRHDNKWPYRKGMMTAKKEGHLAEYVPKYKPDN